MEALAEIEADCSVVDIDWRMCVTGATSGGNGEDQMKLQVKLALEKEDGTRKHEFFEMSVSQFCELVLALEQAKGKLARS